MNIKHVIFDENSFGITQRSLKILRDTLARGIDQHIAVIEVPTNDICCGYLILNKDAGIATFTGDGFRADGGGEGGAGYRSAQAILNLFNIRALSTRPVNIEEIYRGHTESVRETLLTLVREIEKSLEDDDFVRPSDGAPR